jgi:hypothetical protein
MRWPSFEWGGMKRLAAIVLAAVALTACAGSNVVADKSRRFDQATAAYDAGDYATAYSIWSRLADENDLAAMRNAAHLLRRGKGVAQNPGRALDLYTEAARKGLVLAMANVAEMHMNGEGTLKDPEEAARWYAMAANGGLSIAMVRLAEMLEQGNGVKKDPEKARELYARAAKNGYVPAQDRVASVPLTAPQPVAQPVALAASAPAIQTVGASRRSSPVVDELDLKAGPRPSARQQAAAPRGPTAVLQPVDEATLAQLSREDAQKMQAGWVAYQAGHMRDALKVWRSLADKGVPAAQIRVAGMFEEGNGVGRDPIEAYRWYRLAAGRNNLEAASAAARLSAQLSPAEKAIAESMVAAPHEWQNRQR